MGFWQLTLERRFTIWTLMKRLARSTDE